MSAAERLFELSPETYAQHALHGHNRDFRETNCYADVWIELLHALGLEPMACLGFTVASDFEGDQWTFFKPRHEELDRLYGVRVEELTLWRSLAIQAADQVGRRRVPVVEVDAYFLPDTAGSDYRRQHAKTTVAITGIDLAAKRLQYFHNTSLYALSGEDYDGVFRPGPSERADYLPPYCEIVKPERACALGLEELRAISRELFEHHYARRPEQNPLEAHGARMQEHVQLIIDGGTPAYHAYSFAAMRQLGACFELLASYLYWLDGGAGGRFSLAGSCFSRIPATVKMSILKLARVPVAKRPADLSASFASMADDYERGMELIGAELRA